MEVNFFGGGPKIASLFRSLRIRTDQGLQRSLIEICTFRKDNERVLALLRIGLDPNATHRDEFRFTAPVRNSQVLTSLLKYGKDVNHLRKLPSLEGNISVGFPEYDFNDSIKSLKSWGADMSWKAPTPELERLLPFSFRSLHGNALWRASRP